jgi:SnoaL-like domain
MDAQRGGGQPRGQRIERSSDMDAANLVERYIETWNETDPEARRSAIASLWAEDGRYVDPLASVSGQDEISALIGSVHERAPGHVFRLLDDRVDAHHNLMRFSWELVPASGGESVAVGFDVAVTEEDGRIGSVLGFLDKAPGA